MCCPDHCHHQGVTLVAIFKTTSFSVEGDRKSKQSPLGSDFVAYSRPPWASMIAGQIYKPIPMPSGLVV
jgi:hypothetical protein